MSGRRGFLPAGVWRQWDAATVDMVRSRNVLLAENGGPIHTKGDA